MGVLLLVQATAGCIIQGDKCDANQVAYTGLHAVCLCAADHVPDADGDGCVPCGENETSAQSICICKTGFTRASAAEACMPAEASASCESDEGCPATTPYCVRSGSEPGYCTRTGCTANADCPVNWSCETGPSARYCANLPRGLGTACESNADCASFDARFCDSLLTHTCILSGCATREITCPNEWLCCDYSALLGSAFSTCTPPSYSTSGTCPQGGVKVTP
ncbi:MAG: hypothetical protein ABW252_09565 [Polyangiales bacterium]